MRMRMKTAISLLMIMAISCPLWSGTTGKIAGTVIDEQNGEPLAGANVVVQGTEWGAAANLNGQFTILHLPPGLYNLKISVMGYATTTVTEVRVDIDQTARVDVALNMVAVEGQAVTIVAERNIIKPDVASSVVAVTAQEVTELPISNILA